MKTPIIDLLVTIIDNYGDMGTACELITALRSGYGDQYGYVIWTNDVDRMSKFARTSGIGDIAIEDISVFGKNDSVTRGIPQKQEDQGRIRLGGSKGACGGANDGEIHFSNEDIRSFSEIPLLRKPAIVISILHTPLPDLDLFAPHALILRLDYLSLDPIWLQYNETEHIASTPDRRIIEIIPSPLEGGAGLVAHSSISQDKNTTFQKHITLFAYPDTFTRIDWESFPSDLTVYIFNPPSQFSVLSSQFSVLPFLLTHEFYHLIDTSEFAIIRGDTTFAHMIQGGVPFFWDMYRGLGGFPREQSDAYLSLIGASGPYHDVHEILNGQKVGKITYEDLTIALMGTEFPRICTKNLIHTMKKHIDRFENSI